MKRKIFLLSAITPIIIALFGFAIQNSALAQSSSGDNAVGGVLLGLIGLYYLYICLVLIMTFLHMILATIAIIDIAKRPNEVINKEIWIAGIILPGSFIFLSQIGGVFISVGVELYYLFVKRNQLENN